MKLPELQAGQQMGSWVLEQRIHFGSHAQIWRARNAQGPIALKVAISNDWSDVLDRESNILFEAQLPGVVRFIEAEAGGRWMAMDWVDGIHASAWAETHSLLEIAEVLRKFSASLSQLHGNGLVHGDLAPGNLLVDPKGNPWLVDFGLGVGSEPVAERVGMHGTPGYVAPELLDGGTPNSASDQYSLGALAYRMLTGKHPFAGVASHALQWHPRVSLPPPPSASRFDIPLELDALILRLLSRDPLHRPSAGQVEGLWEEMAKRPPPRPIQGNAAVRSSLRDAVAKAQDGDRIHVLVHGPLGSGRQTLIQEARRIAGLDGLEVLFLDFDEVEDNSEIQSVLGDALGGEPGLCLIRARHAFDALENQGLIHLRVAPLEPEDVAQLMRYCSHDHTSAETICQLTQGHPAAIWAHLGFPEEFAEAALPAQALISALRRGPKSIQALSTRLGISEHSVLDLAEPLLDQGAIIEMEDGALLGLPMRPA